MKTKIYLRLKSTVLSKRASYLMLLFLGIVSTIWFLVRVIPKPSRAYYPCMRTASPFMATFVAYIIGVFATVKFMKLHIRNTTLLAIIFIFASIFSFTSSVPNIQLVENDYYQANQVLGSAKGIYPGRVAWVHNPDATNRNLKNTANDYWSSDINCNQSTVDVMLTNGLLGLTGKNSAENSWDALFRYYNKKNKKGDIGYQAGEKIAIKINLTTSYWLATDKLSANMDATPQLVYSLLKQLIEVAKIPQENIWIGDNYRTFRDNYYDKLHSKYPDVHYYDGKGKNGREKTVPSSQLLVFSDKQETSSIPMHYVNADYIINMPCLKSHEDGGITLAAKNHQGSVLYETDLPENQSAYFMHYSLPTQSIGSVKYRHLVDYMGHKHLGGKTLLYLVDAIWSGKSSGGKLEKWKMAPFNDDYTSSLFLSQDACAIESVGFDFLLAEYATRTSDRYPYIKGTDDYLIQAADSSQRPIGINYDPEEDGTVIGSLGVYEHWNNATEKRYSRNISSEGKGIELMLIDNNLYNTVGIQNIATSSKIYPNPFQNNLNIEMKGSDLKELRLKIFDGAGNLVFSTLFKGKYNWNGFNNQGKKINQGMYFLEILDKSENKIYAKEKIIYIKD